MGVSWLSTNNDLYEQMDATSVPISVPLVCPVDHPAQTRWDHH